MMCCFSILLMMDIQMMIVVVSDTSYFVTNCGKLQLLICLFSCSLDKFSGTIPGRPSYQKAQLLDIG